MDEEEVQRLAEGFLAADMTRDEMGRLAALLSENGPAAREIARQLHLHGALAGLGRATFDVDATMALLPAAKGSDERSVMAYVRSGGPRPARGAASRRPAWWLGWLVAAATTALAAWLLVARNRPVREESRVVEESTDQPRARRDPAPATSLAGPPTANRAVAAMPLAVASATGRVLGLVGKAQRFLVAGTPLAPGEGIVTIGRTSQVGLDLGPGSHVEIGADSVAPALMRESEDGPHMFLARGSAVARVRLLGARPLTIATPHAVVELGTAQVRVQVAIENTQVAVSSGQARLQARDSHAWKDVSSGQQALTAADGTITISARTGRRLLFVTGTRALTLHDEAVKARLDQLGIDVTTTLPTSMDIEQARESDLIVISQSITPRDLDQQLRDLPVPILTWEPGIYPMLGMVAGPCEADQCGWAQKGRALIKDPGQILAAGLSTVDLFKWRSIPWGIPTADAVLVATIRDEPAKAVIFAYERGVAMAGLAAPARRVGFFFGELGPGLTKTDPAWKLFDQAVSWCLGTM